MSAETFGVQEIVSPPVESNNPNITAAYDDIQGQILSLMASVIAASKLIPIDTALPVSMQQMEPNP
jgi:hypothetical protein